MNVMLIKIQKIINEQKRSSKFFEFLESSKFVDVFIVNDDNDDDNDDISRFVTKNIDFFYFNHDNKFATIESSLNNTNDEILFRDVYIFVNRIKNFVDTQDVEFVRNNLFKYLKNNVLI